MSAPVFPCEGLPRRKNCRLGAWSRATAWRQERTTEDAPGPVVPDGLERAGGEVEVCDEGMQGDGRGVRRLARRKYLEGSHCMSMLWQEGAEACACEPPTRQRARRQAPSRRVGLEGGHVSVDVVQSSDGSCRLPEFEDRAWQTSIRISPRSRVTSGRTRLRGVGAKSKVPNLRWWFPHGGHRTGHLRDRRGDQQTGVFLSLYTFDGLKSAGFANLHITSTRFRRAHLPP